MNPQQRELLRDALVAALVVAAPVTLPAATLMGAARAAGFRLDDAELLQHIDYLVKSGLAQEKEVRLSAGLKRWESTADAVNYCEGKGLV